MNTLKQIDTTWMAHSGYDSAPPGGGPALKEYEAFKSGYLAAALKDGIKTNEINILVTENRDLITKRDGMLMLFKKTLNVLTEFGQITDESRVGWLIAEIDKTLGEFGHPSEHRDNPELRKWISDGGPLDCWPTVHGYNCEKVLHTVEGYLNARTVQDGHMHGPEDDSPFDVDGVKYCGRCHKAI